MIFKINDSNKLEDFFKVFLPEEDTLPLPFLKPPDFIKKKTLNQDQNIINFN